MFNFIRKPPQVHTVALSQSSRDLFLYRSPPPSSFLSLLIFYSEPLNLLLYSIRCTSTLACYAWMIFHAFLTKICSLHLYFFVPADSTPTVVAYTNLDQRRQTLKRHLALRVRHGSWPLDTATKLASSCLQLGGARPPSLQWQRQMAREQHAGRQGQSTQMEGNGRLTL